MIIECFNKTYKMNLQLHTNPQIIKNKFNLNKFNQNKYKIYFDYNINYLNINDRLYILSDKWPGFYIFNKIKHYFIIKNPFKIIKFQNNILKLIKKITDLNLIIKEYEYDIEQHFYLSNKTKILSYAGNKLVILYKYLYNKIYICKYRFYKKSFTNYKLILFIFDIIY